MNDNEARRGPGRPRKIYPTSEGTTNDKAQEDGANDIQAESAGDTGKAKSEAPKPLHRGLVYTFSPYFNA
jgi:hypothetical protein